MSPYAAVSLRRNRFMKTKMTRRDFARNCAVAGMLAGTGGCAIAPQPIVGSRLPPWRRGQLQLHFIYAGSSESVFMIMPDGTSMLVDVGDYDVGGNWKCCNPVDTLGGRGPGRFVADYIRNVNPHGRKVDYWMLTHYHADHGGCEISYSRREMRDGEVWFSGGLAELIDQIDFGKGFDRCWPNLADPFPVKDTTVRQFAQISRTYRYLERTRGFKIEKFRVGERDQIRLVHEPSAFPDFDILNICGNGVIRTRDGSTRNLYEGFIPKSDIEGWRRENGLSLGFIATYGGFRFYTAGDFQDFWTRPDGTAFQLEDELAPELDRVDVAKTNHHASDSMTAALVKSLAAKVWVTCSVSCYSNMPPALGRLTDRSIYPDERLIAPTYYHLRERIAEMGEERAKRDIAVESYSPSHVVVTVDRNAGEYDLAYLKGDDSLEVKSIRKFSVHKN